MHRFVKGWVLAASEAGGGTMRELGSVPRGVLVAYVRGVFVWLPLPQTASMARG